MIAVSGALLAWTSPPAVAADVVGPSPDAPAVVVVEPPPVPEPDTSIADPTAADAASTATIAVDAAAEAVDAASAAVATTVAATQSPDGDVTVSVRVASPGTDGPATQAQGASAVVSPAPAPDITVDSPTSAPVTENGSATDQSGSTGGNLNVSVRVGSPGDGGPVAQETVTDVEANGGSGETNTNIAVRVLSPGDDHSTADVVDPDEGPVATVVGVDGSPPTSTASDDTRYQDPNTQYQSQSADGTDPWNWTWMLSVDCEGNVLSTSEATGLPSSQTWSWNWDWNWGCNPNPGSTDQVASTQTGSPQAEPGPGTTDASSEPANPPPADAAAESGTVEWTWTFTICGREITVALLASSDGTLTWTWNWNWNWSCPDSSSPPGAIGTDSTPGASPTDAGPASPTSEAQSRTVESSASPNDTIDAIAAAISDATQTPFATEPSAAQPIEVTVVAPTPAGTASVQVSVTIPTVVLAHPAAPTVVPNSPAASPPAGTSPITHPSAPPSAKEHAAWFAPTVDANRFRPRTATTEERPLKRPQPPKATVRPAPSRDDTPHRSPVDNPLTLELGGSTAPSGAGALVVLVLVATLTGALVLAAPGLGRRIRSAREPIPRDRYRRRIDLPG